MSDQYSTVAVYLEQHGQPDIQLISGGGTVSLFYEREEDRVTCMM
jgi:hypothetical protein